MKIGAKLNIWSMLLMLFCWAAIFIPIPSIPFNRHYVILTTSIIVFFLSVMGLGLMIADQVAMELKVENKGRMLAPDGDEVKGETHFKGERYSFSDGAPWKGRKRSSFTIGPKVSKKIYMKSLFAR